MPNRSLDTANTEAVERFVQTANRFCAMLEGASGLSGPQVVRNATERLVELYRAALDLPDIEPATDTDDFALRAAANEDAHKVLESFPSELAAYATHWHTFDPLEAPPDQPVASDLRHDLVEIYEDVRAGLHSWATASADDRADLAWGWRFGFVSHWGRHATAALAAMHALLHDRFIEHPSPPTA